MEKFITDKFGYTIAFLLPGFVTILGVRYYFSSFDLWLNNTCNATQSISGFIYVILSSLSLGIIISAVRWIIFDKLLFKEICQKISELDYAKLLSQKIEAYIYIKEIHYHFYQFYANISVSLFMFSILSAIRFKEINFTLVIILLVLEAILICGSKNCLNNLYKKADALSK